MWLGDREGRVLSKDDCLIVLRVVGVGEKVSKGEWCMGI